MKQKKFFLVALPVTIIVLLSASISFSGQDLWPKKAGELCWDVYSDLDSPDPTGLLRLYIIKAGKHHYLVNGSNEEIDHTPLVNGNAIVYPDKIVIHASSSGYSGGSLDPSEVRGLLGTIILDRETLDGTFRGVNIKYKILPEYPGDLEANTGGVSYDGVQSLIFVPCD